MIILDTDCLSLFEREKHLESSILRAKLDRFDSDDIATTIITFEDKCEVGWRILQDPKILSNKFLLIKD